MLHSQVMLVVLSVTLWACSEPPTDLPRTCPAGGHDRVVCEAAGGVFSDNGFTRVCICPTHEASKSCVDSSDCLGSCVFRNAAVQGCETATVGSCSEFVPWTGCNCNLVAGTRKYTCPE